MHDEILEQEAREQLQDLGLDEDSAEETLAVWRERGSFDA